MGSCSLASSRVHQRGRRWLEVVVLSVASGNVVSPMTSPCGHGGVLVQQDASQTRSPDTDTGVTRTTGHTHARPVL
eukprot:3818766-Prymnesium_polylepis.1